MKRLACLLLMLTTLLRGEQECIGPWLTGPLLTPSGHVVPEGFINIEPYIFYSVDTGAYLSDWKSVDTPDFTSNQYLVPIWVGMTPWMDIQFVFSATWQNVQGVSSLVFNDFRVEFDFQLLEDTQTNRVPGIKLYISETFPTGPYEKLDPAKRLTDSGGSGAYETSIGTVITRTIEMKDCRYFSWRINPFAIIPSKVSVFGLNTYGGASDTNARIRPPHSYGAILGLEYMLTQNWALAFDLEGVCKTKRKASGFPGTGPGGKLLSLERPSGIQFSIAPAIEYNVSAEIGFIGGLWFTIAGKNQPRFFGGAIAFNYYGHTQKGERHRFRTKGGTGGR